MKKYLIAILFIVRAGAVRSKNKNVDSVYNAVDIRASYPGGLEQLYQYFGHNVKYPAAAREANKQRNIYYICC